MNDCIFCKIVSGDIPSHKIYEDEHFYAFLDMFPLAEGHTLVIPKKHYGLVWDMPETTIGKYFEVCKRIANHYQTVSRNNYVYSFIHGEGVAHAHIHVIPSQEKDFGERFSKTLNTEFHVEKLDNAEKAQQIREKYSLDKK